MSLQKVNNFIGHLDNVSLKKISSPTYSLRSELSSIHTLKNSIVECGLLQPIIVRPVHNGYEVVAGNRRLEACKQLLWIKIPCIIIELNDKEAFEVALTENIQRKTLNPVEESKAFRMYVDDFGWGGVTDIAKRIGKSPQYVSQRLKLLLLPKNVLRKLSEGVITPSLLREVVNLDKCIQKEIIKLAVNEKLSSRQVNRLVLHTQDKMSFPQYFSVDSKEEKDLRFVNKLINKCIDSLRFSLNELDNAINYVDENWSIREVLMSQRRITHNQIDVLIRSKRNGKLNIHSLKSELLVK